MTHRPARLQEGDVGMSEVSRVLNFLASAGPHATTAVLGGDADEIMLQTGGTIIAQGRLYNIKSKRLGPNVYRLSLELANP